MRNHALLHATLCLSLLTPVARGADRFTLENGNISADFDSSGLAQLTLLNSKQSLILANDSAMLTVNGERLAAQASNSSTRNVRRRALSILIRLAISNSGSSMN